MVSLRPATQADILAVIGKPLPHTVMAFVGEEQGRVLGLGAMYVTDGTWVLICAIAQDVRPLVHKHAKAMLVGARRLLALAAQTRLPVRTVADTRHPRAIELIEHLGFRHIEKDVYEWAIKT